MPVRKKETEYSAAEQLDKENVQTVDPQQNGMSPLMVDTSAVPDDVQSVVSNTSGPSPLGTVSASV